jgi:hypothetical protein
MYAKNNEVYFLTWKPKKLKKKTKNKQTNLKSEVHISDVFSEARIFFYLLVYGRAYLMVLAPLEK